MSPESYDTNFMVYDLHNFERGLIAELIFLNGFYRRFLLQESFECRHGCTSNKA